MLTRREAAAAIGATALSIGVAGAFAAEDITPRPLPPPRASGGMPLFEALKLRRSTRAYSARPLEPQVLSDLLWAANGVNRRSGDRTAPYWRHIMVIDIYAAMADGVWLYDPKAHALIPHSKDDLRALSGTQDFVGTAPLNLVYVAHGERMTDVSRRGAPAVRIRRRLFHRAERLSLLRIARACDRLSRLGQSGEARRGDGPSRGQFVTFAQTVGYPAA